jgi:hypothetical protein
MFLLTLCFSSPEMTLAVDENLQIFLLYFKIQYIQMFTYGKGLMCFYCNLPNMNRKNSILVM